MTQHNLTQILKVIRDLVMRNRPCYRDYLGSETVTKTMQIGAGTFVANDIYVKAEFPVTDSAFTGFVLGETYTVSIDGVTADYVARNLSPISDEVGPVICTTTTFDMENYTFDGWVCSVGRNPDEKVACSAQTFDMSFVGKTISISQTRTETVKRYNTKLLPEYLLPAFLRKNVVASKTEVQSAASAANTAQTTADAAQSTADAAQTTANAKFQLLQQTTVTTNTTIGTVDNNVGPVSVKGLNIAVGSPIKVTANGNLSGTEVWGKPYTDIEIRDVTGKKVCSLLLELSQDGETYIFTNQTPSIILSNLVINYEKVVIPKVVYQSRGAGAWLPPYLIANCLYLTKKNAGSDSATLYRITVDDTGTLKATEVT